ncbi:MAG TPA: porin family protein [Bacteroidales bacterium]|nr:porin family protein [Bacteroidales bacterium]HRZ49539.1 porin family protein [Bacteroidales bacterium]
MKRLVLAVWLVGGLTLWGQSQTFRGGLTGGLVASQVSGDNSAGYNKPGFFFGPWANFDFREQWRFQMEITFIQKGSRQLPSLDNGYYSYRSRMNYIEAPMMFRYKWKPRIEPEIGIAYSYMISSYEELYEVEISSRPFYRHNSSLILGVYYHFNERWSLNLRTSNSITPIRKHLSGQTYRLNFGQTHNLLSTGVFFSL